MILFSLAGVTILPVDGVSGELPLPEGPFPLLEQILREAAVHSDRMIEEGLRIEEARAESLVHGAGRYPSVSGTFRYVGRLEDRDDFDRTRTFYQPQAMLAARQPLYHWGALRAGNRIGELRLALARGNRAEAYRMLALSIREAFLDLAVRQKSIDHAELRHEQARHELSIARARFRGEEITAEALRGAELAEAEADLHLDRLRRERQRAIDDFSRLAGFSPDGEEWIPAKIPAVAHEFSGEGDRIQPSGERYRPWEQVSRLRIHQAEEQAAIEAARGRPRLDLVAGVAQDQVPVAGRSDVDRILYFAGLELTWNLFDGHETRGRRAAARARQRLETRRHEREEEEWAAGLKHRDQTVEWAARALALAEERLELAGRNLSQREEDLQRGEISEAEMLAARVAHAERDLSATARRAEYLMAVAEAVSHAGVDPAMEFYLRVH